MSNPEINNKIKNIKMHVHSMNTRVNIGGYGLSVEPIQRALFGILDILEDIEKDRNNTNITPIDSSLDKLKLLSINVSKKIHQSKDYLEGDKNITELNVELKLDGVVISSSDIYIYIYLE